MNTVGELFEATARRHPARTALASPNESGWSEISWSDYYDRSRAIATRMAALGVERGDRVAILGANRVKWFLTCQGAVLAGAIPVGLYVTASPDQCSYIIGHSEPKLMVIENRELLQQHRSWLRQRGLPVVLMEGDADGASPWSHLEPSDGGFDAELVGARQEAVGPGDLYALIYTSGTTGHPKAVMLTHHNATWTAERLVESYDFAPEHRVLSYLPLCHIAEQIVSLIAPMTVGASSWMVPKIENLGDALQSVRPQFFLGVPRVWEKIQAGIEAKVSGAPKTKQRLFRWARAVGFEAGCRLQHGEKAPLMTPLVRKLVLMPLRRRLGLDRAHVCATSTAPIGQATLDFFLSLGIPLLEVYGMTECTGPATFSTPTDFRIGRAGRCVPGARLRIGDGGEIQMSGPHVFAGYYRDEEATKEALTEDGWLRSGDLGELDEEGFLQITGRRKELIITAGGKNIAPVAVEQTLLEIPELAQAVVVGDRRKFLVALLTLDPHMALQRATSLGSKATALTDLAHDPKLRKYLQKAVENANRKLARVETVKRFAVLPNEFSIDGGELTPTLKLRRAVINSRYAREIEDLYAESA